MERAAAFGAEYATIDGMLASDTMVSMLTTVPRERSSLVARGQIVRPAAIPKASFEDLAA